MRSAWASAMAETVSNELILSSAPAAKAGAAIPCLGDGLRAGRGARHRRSSAAILTASYRAILVVPDGIRMRRPCAARETLAGAMHVAEQVGGQVGAALHAAAAAAFDAGVVVTSLIGAGFVLAAAVVAAMTLGAAGP